MAQADLITHVRQQGILDPFKFKKSIAVIGAGATGSYVSVFLAQMGCADITVWDNDKVESHNPPNQVYDIPDIGRLKVDALKDIILRKTGIEIKTRNEFVTNQDVAKSYVFLLVDTMKSRREIFENCLERRFNIDLVIETRMDIDSGRVYAFNPCAPAQVEEWKATLYTDEQAVASPCGASASIIPTVVDVVSKAVWRMIQHWDIKFGPNRSGQLHKLPMPNESLLAMGPEQVLHRSFKTL